MLKTTRGRIKAGAIGCLILIVLLFVATPTIFRGYTTFRESLVKRSLNIYDGVNKAYEDGHQIDLKTYEKRLYYWTEDPIEVVRTFYQPQTSQFIHSDDGQGDWWIARLDPVSEPRIMPGGYVLHSSFCAHYEDYSPWPSGYDLYDCVTVALVDMGQDDFHRLGIMAQSRLESGELPPELDALPRYGTLIIFGYYIDDFS